MKEGVISYPGRLKNPFNWIIEHYPETKVTILPYAIKPIKSVKQAKQEEAKKVDLSTFFGMTIANFAEKVVGNNTKKQLGFMKKFTELCIEFSDSSSGSDEENSCYADNKVLTFKK